MPELKTILVRAGGYVWRTLLLSCILALAGLMLFISMVTAATAENNAADRVTKLLSGSEHLPQIASRSIPYVVPAVIVFLPFLVTWALREHAVNQLKKSWTQSRAQACEYFSWGETNGVQVQFSGRHCNWILRSYSPSVLWED